MAEESRERMFSIESSRLSDQQDTVNEAAENKRPALRTITLHWADSPLEPIYFTDSSIKFWEDGAWAQESTIEDRSSHSDWDVWIDLYLKNTNGDETARLGDQVWFQDLDVGEKYTKNATGWSAAVRDNFRFLDEGYWVAGMTRHKRRDN